VITLNDDTNEVCWQISVSNITLPAIAAHIHPGATGVAGNPLVSLSRARTRVAQRRDVSKLKTPT
jgi:hypothetical protein